MMNVRLLVERDGWRCGVGVYESLEAAAVVARLMDEHDMFEGSDLVALRGGETWLWQDEWVE